MCDGGSDRGSRMHLEGEERVVAWFEKDVLPRLAREGCFPSGTDSTVLAAEFRSTERNTDHFASSPFFLDLTLGSSRGRIRLDLFVKFTLQDEDARDKINPDRQFCNEVKMYCEVFPEFRKWLSKCPKAPSNLMDELCSKCYHANFDSEDPLKSVLLLEDLTKMEYRTAESKVFLDYQHCATAVKQLARFHAISLSMKLKCPETLDRLKSVFVEARYFDDRNVRDFCEFFHKRCNQRAIEYLLAMENSPVPRDYILNFQKLLGEPYDLMMQMIQPEEPIALICHGDFCRNNVLFRYEGDSVVDAKLFDFQVSRYGPPSIDLTFFVYMNTTQAFRNEHFDELFALYYSTLTKTVADIADVPETEVSRRFPFRMFADDFARHAVYAYNLVSFFIAAMSEATEVDWNMSLSEQAEILYAKGGEKVTKEIADVIIDFYNRKFYVP